MLHQATKDVGPENVILGGLSQGGATTLISLLTWEGKPLAAAFGLCGWLPFRQHIADIVDFQTQGEDSVELFARKVGSGIEVDLPIWKYVIRQLRLYLEGRREP